MRFKCSRLFRSSASASTAGRTNAYTINRMAARHPPTSASSNFQSASNSFNALPLAHGEFGTAVVEREGTPCSSTPGLMQGLLVLHDFSSYKMVRDSAKLCAQDAPDCATRQYPAFQCSLLVVRNRRNFMRGQLVQ